MPLVIMYVDYDKAVDRLDGDGLMRVLRVLTSVTCQFLLNVSQSTVNVV